MSVSHHPRLEELLDEILPLASGAISRPLFWIETPDGDGGEWCGDCARAKLRNLRRRDRSRRCDYYMSGGYRTESDHSPFCAGCGVRLEASLTHYGALEELDHFARYGVTPGSSGEAYEIAEVLMTLRYTSADHDDAAEEAGDLAEALMWSAI